VYGCAAVTAVTAQNNAGVTAVDVVSADVVDQQLDSVLSHVPIAAVKIGMLGNEAVVDVVARRLRAKALRYIVLDPAIRSTSGATLLSDAGVAALRSDLLPLTFVLTPNAVEAGRLLGGPPAKSLNDMREMAAALRRRGAAWVLITGGHLDLGDTCIDLLHDGHSFYEIAAPRVRGATPRGTGCTHSSVVAAMLAKGHEVHHACSIAQWYVGQAIVASRELATGPGSSALRHLPFDPDFPDVMPAQAPGNRPA
jgi:hydroxymethylpyrimidine/phosphomethylpyrimidine kinase